MTVNSTSLSHKPGRTKERAWGNPKPRPILVWSQDDSLDPNGGGMLCTDSTGVLGLLSQCSLKAIRKARWAMVLHFSIGMVEYTLGNIPSVYTTCPIGPHAPTVCQKTFGISWAGIYQNTPPPPPFSLYRKAWSTVSWDTVKKAWFLPPMADICYTVVYFGEYSWQIPSMFLKKRSVNRALG